MATEEQFIDRVRRKVNDFDEPRVYDNNYYQDAIRFALSKLSYDFDESYVTPDSVPPEREFFVVKLATIEMCHVRAGKVLSGEDSPSSSESLGDLTQLEVPDLRIEAQTAANSAEIASSWLKMAKDLQEEYDGELDGDGGTSKPIETGYMNAHSYRNGGLANRRLDRGLPAVTLGATVSGLNIRLSWSTLYHPEFSKYEVRRSTNGFVSVDSLLATIYDNHEVAHLDVVPSAGTYQYRVLTINPNAIKTPSNTLSLVVV